MSSLLQEVLKQVEQLSPQEQLELIQRVAEGLKKSGAVEQADVVENLKPKRKWSELKGMAPYPIMGEDAQEWVSRTRREGDEHRDQVLRGE